MPIQEAGSLLEEISAPPIKKHHHNPLPVHKPKKNWLAAYPYLGIFVFSLAVCALVFQSQYLSSIIQLGMVEFRWLVLVNGTPLEVDDTGRMLGQLPYVSEVVYYSQEDALATLKDTNVLPESAEIFTANDLLPGWVLRFDPPMLDSPGYYDLMFDAKQIPGVVDLAFNKDALDRLRSLRSQWYQSQVTLSLVGLVGIVVAFMLGGQFFFFTHKKKINTKALLQSTGWAAFSWGCGFVIIGKMIGWPSFIYLFIGLGFGPLLYVYQYLRAEKIK